MLDEENVDLSRNKIILKNDKNDEESYGSYYSDSEDNFPEVDSDYLDFFDYTITNDINENFPELVALLRKKDIGESFGTERIIFLIQKIVKQDDNFENYTIILYNIIKRIKFDLMLVLFPPNILLDLYQVPFNSKSSRIFQFLIRSKKEYAEYLVSCTDFLIQLSANLKIYQDNLKYHYRLIRELVRRLRANSTTDIIYHELLTNFDRYFEDRSDISIIETLKTICYYIKYGDHNRKAQFLQEFPYFEIITQDERFLTILLETYYYCISERSECDIFLSLPQFAFIVELQPKDSDLYAEAIQVFIQIASTSLEYRELLYNNGVASAIIAFVIDEPPFKITMLAVELLAMISQVTNIDVQLGMVSDGLLVIYQRMLLSIHRTVLEEVLNSVNALLSSAQENNCESLFDEMQSILLEPFEDLDEAFVSQKEDYHDENYGYVHSLLTILRDDFIPDL